jgi:hypothetical protein
MAKVLPNAGWKLGLLCGAIVGALLVWLQYLGPPDELGIDRVVLFLSACPPFTVEAIYDLDRQLQWVILFAWWALTGAALGHLLRGSRWDLVAAVLFILSLLAVHNLAYENLELKINKTIKSIEHKFDLDF